MTNQEYYHIGHDEQESCFDSQDAKRSRTSYLFAGIGDARNLHATWMDIHNHERKTSASPKAMYHFTIIDTKAATLARAIIIFLLLEELSDTSGMTNDQREEILGTLFYVYINHIMPPQAWTKFQKTIARAIDLLGQSLATFTWFDILQKDREPITAVLKLWKDKTAQVWTTAEFRQRGLWEKLRQQNNPYAMEDPEPTPKGCKKDKLLYEAAGIMAPPPSFLVDDPIELRKTMAHKNFPKNIKADWLAKMEKSWMPNVTLIDLGHLKQQALCKRTKDDIEVDLSTDLIAQWTGYLWSKPRNPSCLYDYAADYFTKVAAALDHLKGRLRVEPILGEMCEVFEKMRFGFYTDRVNKPPPGQSEINTLGKTLTEGHPTNFDRVHLSNVPDYTGGSLSALLFAAPITPITRSFEARVAFTCLRNPPAFKDVESFDNEYCLLPTKAAVARIFACLRAPVHEDTMPGFGLIGAGYMQWSRVSDRIGFNNLMDRQSLTAWVHGLLLKTAIPEQREVPAMTLINSPFNLTLLFRIFRHLQGIGYPSHWLSDILSNLLTSPLETRAFPQRSVPYKISDTKQLLDKSRPLSKFSIKPFNAELTTLTTMWLPTLGFGLLKGSESLPKPQSIHKYSVKFDNVDFGMGFESAFIIVLINMDVAVSARSYPVIPLRLLLINKEDELRGALRRPRDVREKGLHIVTTWKFETETKTAQFWMREDVMKDVMDKKHWWHACIWRVDRWDIVGQPVEAACGGVQDLNISWAD